MRSTTKTSTPNDRGTDPKPTARPHEVPRLPDARDVVRAARAEALVGLATRLF